jgi:hypothetical protein
VKRRGGDTGDDAGWGVEPRCMVVALVGLGAMASWLIPIISFVRWM